jgi:hypothetical protein
LYASTRSGFTARQARIAAAPLPGGTHR